MSDHDGGFLVDDRIEFPAPKTRPLTSAEHALATAPGSAIQQSGRDEDAVGVVVVDVASIEEFAAVEEPGADPLVGRSDSALIPTNGDVMFYGDGGSGKTSLSLDLACHLAAGDDWLGITVVRSARVLLIENEGPRPLFRAKLRRKLDGWTGSAIDGRVEVFEEPWGRFTFDSPEWRQTIATVIRERAVDVVVVGPVSRSGMNEAGTLQEVRDFANLLATVRDAAARLVTFALIHHENKGGKVSGAWEGSGDTLFHVQGQGHGRTRLYVQKARWSSEHHGKTLHLRWTDGEGFAIDETPELDDDTICERIVAAIEADPGTSWTRVEKATPGIAKDRRRAVRDGLLLDGRIVNVVSENDERVLLRECPERRKASLYLADDPTIANLRRTSGADAAQSAPATAGSDQLQLRPAPDRKEGAGAGAAVSPPQDKEGEQSA